LFPYRIGQKPSDWIPSTIFLREFPFENRLERAIDHHSLQTAFGQIVPKAVGKKEKGKVCSNSWCVL
jgi:hypothetical protein